MANIELVKNIGKDFLYHMLGSQVINLASSKIVFVHFAAIDIGIMQVLLFCVVPS